MKKLASLNGVKTLGRTAQKSIHGGSGIAFGCSGQPKVYKGVCGNTPAIPCNIALPTCAGGEIVNGNCYICV